MNVKHQRVNETGEFFLFSPVAIQRLAHSMAKLNYAQLVINIMNTVYRFTKVYFMRCLYKKIIFESVEILLAIKTKKQQENTNAHTHEHTNTHKR